MGRQIERVSAITNTYTLTASASTSPTIPFGGAAGGVFVVDAVTGSPTSVSWYAAFGPEGTPAQLNDGSADVTSTITTGKAYPLPDALYGCQFIVGVTNSGTATIRLCVKS
jgi:hypothetical protein